MQQQKQCATCEKIFDKNINRQNSDNIHYYCSKECFLSSKRKKRMRVCSVCNVEFMPKNKQSKESIKCYCPSCRGLTKVNCAICNVEYKERNSNIRKRKTLTCSVACKAVAQRKEWDSLSRGMLKQRYAKEFGEAALICRRCGHGKKYNIVMHHIIYVINGGNNQPENLEPLCLNCHGIEHYENGSDND